MTPLDAAFEQDVQAAHAPARRLSLQLSFAGERKLILKIKIINRTTRSDESNQPTRFCVIHS